MQHTETRWLTIKYVAVILLQHLKFEGLLLEVFTQESNLKSTVAWKRICAALHDRLTEAYISFCAYSTTEFEDFFQFQSDEPRVHLLYFSMC